MHVNYSDTRRISKNVLVYAALVGAFYEDTAEIACSFDDQVITDKESMGLGCPVISGVRAHDSGNCEQDMVYEPWQVRLDENGA